MRHGHEGAAPGFGGAVEALEWIAPVQGPTGGMFKPQSRWKSSIPGTPPPKSSGAA